jgi:hypothetical protein
MTRTRREILGTGGGLAVLSLFSSAAWASAVVDIRMQGRGDGSHAGGDPDQRWSSQRNRTTVFCR